MTESAEIFDAPNGEEQNLGTPEERSRFTPGQPLSFVRVRFPGNARSFPFYVGRRQFSYGQKVMALSDRGMAVGYINSFPYVVPFEESLLPIQSIKKVATDEDLEKEKEIYKKQKEAEAVCLKLIEKYELDMQLTHVEFTQFGKKVVFYFTAPARVDFRDMVKDLVNDLKMRIELRQISVRDRAAALGGLGPCGRELCCSSFLAKYGNINVKLAKNQDLTLNFSKLNGVCGQLKCCLRYEDEVYEEKRQYLPEENTFIQTYNGERGKVTKLHLINEQFEMLTDRGVVKRYVGSMYDHENPLPPDWQFPQEFENISNETSTVIGLVEEQERKQEDKELALQEVIAPAKNYAAEIYNEYFPDLTFSSIETEAKVVVENEKPLPPPPSPPVQEEKKVITSPTSSTKSIEVSEDKRTKTEKEFFWRKKKKKKHH